MTRLTAPSSRHRSSSAPSRRTMPCVTALSAAGRSSVTMPAAPRRSNRISASLAIGSISDEIAAHDQPHDLVAAFENLVDPHVAQHALDRVIAQIAVAAMELQAAIDGLEARIGREPLRHGGEPGRPGQAAVERARGAAHHQARRLELGRVIGDAKAQRLEIGEPRSELLALAHIVDRALEAELRAADRAGRDVEPAAIEPGHGDLEAWPSAPTRLAAGTRQLSN